MKALRILAAAGCAALMAYGTAAAPARGQTAPPKKGGAPVNGAEKPLDTAGGRSGVHSPRNVVVRDAKAWQALWAEHAKGMFQPPPPPAVDFKKDDVIAVFAGAKPTGGYSISIGEVKRTPKSAEVHVTLLKPAPGAIVTQAFTQPFAMRAVPKLPKNVTFKVEEKTR